MQSAPPDPAMDKAAAARRGAWLLQASRAAGWRGGAAAGLLCLDGMGAIGFAAGLAGGLSESRHGLHAAAPWLALLLGSAVFRGVCAWAGASVGAAASSIARGVLRRRAVLACFGLPPGDRPSTGELMAITVDAVESMDGYLARFQPVRRAAAVVPVLILAAACWASWVSAGLMAMTLIPFIMFMVLAGGAAADESRRQFASLQRLSGLFADRVRALPIVLAFAAERAVTASLAAAADALRRRTMAVLRVAFISSAGLEFFSALCVALVAVYAGFNLLRLLPFPSPERLDLWRAVFVLALAPEFYGPLRRLAAAYHDRQAAMTAADVLLGLERPCAAPRRRPPLLEAPAIRFDGATVRYAGNDGAALDDLNLDVAAGEIVCLLGPSGSGKTTVLNLLLGLAPLCGGEVWVGGKALSEYGCFAGSVAWVGQTPMIVPGSIADNIGLACATATPDQIAEAAAMAGLGAMIERRPEGLASLVDERGSGLSGGERRRIALARALLKSAPILLLDEPTAHLDPAASEAMIEAIRLIAHGRTTIIATHSPALAAVADRVVTLPLR